jgi:hypothetical protein
VEYSTNLSSESGYLWDWLASSLLVEDWIFGWNYNMVGRLGWGYRECG